MRTNYSIHRALTIHVSLIVLVIAVTYETTVAQEPAQGITSEQVQANSFVPDTESESALMRGPVHEAFAEQFSDDPVPNEVISQEPPQSINEVPPEFKPEGENIEWIPGYWGWDVEANNFVWVTGVWRNVPPDQQWVPGYWAKVDNGWQWISGFWTAAETEELSYLPVPPEAIENGPSTPAPGEDYFWIPGSWQYDQNQYAWQAGYWAQGQDSWVWVPNRYIWTPSGAIYREGYWDHELEQRGTIFCPMSFQAGYQQQFRPRYVVEVGPMWLANLFVNPGFNHYYFGNYYGYTGNQTLMPWVNYYQRTQVQDPLYSYYAYQMRNANLIRQIARVERQISTNPALRSQATVAAQMQAYNNFSSPQASWALRAIPLQTLATTNVANFDTPFRFTSLQGNRSQLENLNNHSANQLAQTRQSFEQAQTDVDKQRAQRTPNVQNSNSNDPQVNASASGNAAVETEPKRMRIRSETEVNSKVQAHNANENSKNPNGEKSTSDNANKDNDAADKPKSPAEQASNRPGTRPANQPGGASQTDPTNRNNQQGGKKEENTNRKDKPKNPSTDDRNPGNNQDIRNKNPNSPKGDDRQPQPQIPNPNQDKDSGNNNVDAPKPKPNNAKRPIDALNHLNQGGEDTQPGADAARELRDMKRRNNRPAVGSDQPNAGQPNAGTPNSPQTNTPRPQPNRPQPNRPQPNRPQPNRPQPNRPQPNRPQPNQPQPNGARSTEPKQLDPKNLQPKNPLPNVDPGKANPKENLIPRNPEPKNAPPVNVQPKNSEPRNPGNGRRPESAAGGATPPTVKPPKQANPKPASNPKPQASEPAGPKAPAANKPQKNAPEKTKPQKN